MKLLAFLSKNQGSQSGSSCYFNESFLNKAVRLNVGKQRFNVRNMLILRQFQVKSALQQPLDYIDMFTQLQRLSGVHFTLAALAASHTQHT